MKRRSFRVTAYCLLKSLPEISSAYVLAKGLGSRQISGAIESSKFLRRAYQTSAIAGNWIYIDGGQFAFLNDSGMPEYQYSNTILSIDLSQDWTNSTVTIQSTAKPKDAPNLNNPSLWYHEQEGLFYTGFAGWNSSFGDDAAMPPLVIYTFKPDGNGGGEFANIFDYNSPTLAHLTRPSSPFQAYDSNCAWVLGGNDDPNRPPFGLLPGLVQFNMSTRTFTNTTAENYQGVYGVNKGAMHYVPVFGPRGFYVILGGVTVNPSDLGSTKGNLIDFGTLSVFDPAKHEWWNETTTGSAPSPRQEFCVAGMSSTNRTYEIFVYAGKNTDDTGAAAIQYDTINILTLPAFHWISVPYTPQNPRLGVSCNAVGGSQILTVGGTDAGVDGSTKLAPNSFYHSFTVPDPRTQGLAIFDMTALEWASQYTAAAPDYEQSALVKGFYSQSNGYTSYVCFAFDFYQGLNSGIASLVQVQNFPNKSNTAGNSKPSIAHKSPSRAGEIVAGVVGGITRMFIIVGALFYLRKRRASSNVKSAAKIPSSAELASQTGHEDIQEVQNDCRPFEFPELGLQEMPQGTWCLELGNPSPQLCQRGEEATELHGHNIPELPGNYAVVPI